MRPFQTVLRWVLTGGLLLAPGAALSQPGPDRAVAVPDSVGAGALAAPDSSAILAPVPGRPPWLDTAALGPPDLARAHPELLADVLARHPHVSVRTAGAQGSPAYVGIDAASSGAPELTYDGTPSRSPADLDPAVWDRSAVALGWLDAGRDVRSSWSGAPGFEAELDPALPGRTLMRTHFSSAPRETYLRGVSVTTPQAPMVLRLDFEEWKTEEGYLLTGTTAVPAGFGRAKMRRFRGRVAFAGELGETSLAFGRGRRFHRGNLAARGGAVERWTGEVVAGFDREDERGYWRARAYHRDWHDDDAVQDETRDASRLGLSLRRDPLGGGWGASASVERWFAAFDGADGQSHPDPPYVVRAAGSWRSGRARLAPLAALEVVHADHATDPDLGATLALTDPVGGGMTWTLGARRTLRVPTLYETDGRITRDYANGAQLRHLGAGALPLERQDRGYVRIGGAHARGSWEAGVEHVRLTEGIGWEAPSALGDAPTEVQTRGGLELDVTQVTLRGEARLGSAGRGASIQASGHQVLGEAPRADGGHRGGGWPVYQAELVGRAWHQVGGPQNTLSLEARAGWWGTRHDDQLAGFVGTPQVPAYSRLDLRVVLQVRDASLYWALDNVSDALLVDVLGTVEPARQVRLGLVWPFYN